MASSSSSGSVPNAPRKYDVFISFRGEIPNNLASHLYTALERAFLKVFRDDKKLETSNEIKPSLNQAIEDSSVSIIVFSEDYASSKWCLDELDHIMQFRKDEGQYVIPIFYKVDPRDVRKQTGAYKKAFEKHEIDYHPERVKRWTDALYDAGKLIGKHCQTSTDESNLIKEIVADVSTKLERLHKCQGTLKDAIGIDEIIKPIEELLEKFNKVVIWGMGGVGKTTMAKALFVKLAHRYDNCCFMENIREKMERYGLEHVCNSLVSELLGQDMHKNSSNALSSNAFVARRLGSKKAFVVLDDVHVKSSKQLEDLLDEICNFLGEGSKVLITTRDKKLFLEEKGYEIHKAEGLSNDNSRQLFIHKAFGSNHPEYGYEDRIEGFVDYTQHNPLALKVLGSLLRSVHGKARNLSKEEKEKAWDSLLRKLRAGNPNNEIQEVLILSYNNGLDYTEKQIFLDIACFLKGEREEFVEELLESYEFYPIVGIQTLIDNALIVKTDGKVEMHDLLHEMGLQIVREESIKEPGKRSRLWDPSEIYDVLKNCEGEKEVEGLMFNISGIGPLELTAKTFNKMTRIRFLKFYSSHGIIIPTGLESISSKIRYFHWQGYPGKSLPSNFCAELLLELNLKESMVETLWEGVQDLANLRRLILQKCHNLRELPDFSKACSLESVDLSHCECLSDVPASLLSLHNLISLDVRYCYNLRSLKSRIHLKSLRELEILDCKNLKEFSVSSEELTSLNLSKTLIEELSPSIVRCSKLRQLSIAGCTVLRSLLELPPSLRGLSAADCTSLETVSISTFSSTPQNRGHKSFSFANCVNLDVSAIEEQAKCLLQKAVHEKENVAVSYPGKKVPEWFGNNRTQNDSDTVNLSLSSHTLEGFIFCAVVPDLPKKVKYHPLIISSQRQNEVSDRLPFLKFNPGDVLLGYPPFLPASIVAQIERNKKNHEAATYNPDISFKFSFVSYDRPFPRKEGVSFPTFPAKEGGVYPIYASEHLELNPNSRKRKAIMI
ncbi:hypothetical protein QN277_022361 [Acacia crassicarpa]|uniref:TIR domain-containing protein n=1 Tax=Acacia crassicarpa TaxID=499986 RepID=A0AAE1MKV9_9FABA|nr:hypothetical protein QN277_022361 [Acacia crassicarpa]